MKCKTFECPYLTEEDKKFLEYEQKIYEESAKEIIALYRRCEDKHKSDCDGQDDYSNIQSIFIRDICRYFFQTRGIKELEVFAPQCEVLNKTKILMLDEVFDEYIRKYLEGKQDEK